MSSPTASPQKPSNSRLCLRLFYWTFCLVMRLLFGAIVGILVIAVVAISLSICVFSCRPNAWGLLRGEWLGVVREGLSTSSHSVSNCGFATHHPPPTPQRPPTINPLYPPPTTQPSWAFVLSAVVAFWQRLARVQDSRFLSCRLPLIRLSDTLIGL